MHLRPYLRRSLQGSQKTTGKEILASDTASANTKHNLTASQINIIPYTESQFISFSFTKYIIYPFQQKIIRHATTLYEYGKPRIMGLSHQEFESNSD